MTRDIQAGGRDLEKGSLGNHNNKHVFLSLIHRGSVGACTRRGAASEGELEDRLPPPSAVLHAARRQRRRSSAFQPRFKLFTVPIIDQTFSEGKRVETTPKAATEKNPQHVALQ